MPGSTSTNLFVYPGATAPSNFRERDHNDIEACTCVHVTSRPDLILRSRLHVSTFSPLRPGSRQSGVPSRRRGKVIATGVGSATTRADCDVLCVHPARVARARKALPTRNAIADAASMLRVLGDPTRLTIVRALAAEELCVCDLATLLGQSQSTISTHCGPFARCVWFAIARMGRSPTTQSTTRMSRISAHWH